jgi:hypothetical protein
MTITISALRCSSQVALLGAVTENLKAASIVFNEKNIAMSFYYENEPSEDEVEISEVVASEVVSDFIDAYVSVHRSVCSKHPKLPEGGIWIFYKKNIE